jgi:hypothetical protein
MPSSHVHVVARTFLKVPPAPRESLNQLFPLVLCLFKNAAYERTQAVEMA